MIKIKRNYKKEKNIFPLHERSICKAKYIENNKFSWCNKQKKIQEQLNSYTGFRCTYCGKKIESGEIDHLYPKNIDEFKEFAYEFSNLFIVCSDCNRTRNRRNPEFIQILNDVNFFFPDEIDYEFNKYFIPNFKDGKIEIRDKMNDSIKEKAKNTIEIIVKLNRVSLCKIRQREFQDKSYSLYKYFFKTLM